MFLQRCLTWGGVVLAATPLLLVAPLSALAQHTTASGRDIYMRECASCHGNAATGYGPGWSVLRQAPPDLTGLSSADRPFDASRVRDIVTGHMRRVPPQWPSEMPYWRRSAPADLDALVNYLESAQRRQYGPSRGITIEDQARLGEPLYQSFCASCHGADGRGPHLSGFTLAIAAPDLTMIATRNDGSVDMRRLYESIARCDVESPYMPAWRQVFADMGWPGNAGARMIEDIAWFIESIQRR